MTLAVGETVELCRYRVPAGERAVRAQRVDGRVAVIDVPVDHAHGVYVVEDHVDSYDELTGLAAEYAAHSERCRMPAILARPRAGAHDGPSS